MKNFVLLLIVVAAILGACYYDKTTGTVDFDAMKYDFNEKIEMIVAWFNNTQKEIEEEAPEAQNFETVVEDAVSYPEESVEYNFPEEEEEEKEEEPVVEEAAPKSKWEKFVEGEDAKRQKYADEVEAKMNELDAAREAKFREIEEKKARLFNE